MRGKKEYRFADLPKSGRLWLYTWLYFLYVFELEVKARLVALLPLKTSIYSQLCSVGVGLWCSTVFADGKKSADDEGALCLSGIQQLASGQWDRALDAGRSRQESGCKDPLFSCPASLFLGVLSGEIPRTRIRWFASDFSVILGLKADSSCFV